MKYATFEENFKNTENEKYTRTKCGKLLEIVYNCYHQSTALIKGYDCIEDMKNYLDCCYENRENCPPSLMSIPTYKVEDQDFEELEKSQE